MIKKYATTATDEIPSKKAKYDDDEATNGLDDTTAACLFDIYSARFCPRLEKPDPTTVDLRTANRTRFLLL